MTASGTPDMLAKILAAKHEEIARLDLARGELERLAARAPDPRPLSLALLGPRVALIAEVKRASPSRGTLASLPHPDELAQLYEDHGASGCSVLTDRHFQGTLDDLTRIRASISLPILRKDFLVRPSQLYQSRAAGADVVLLIVAALPDVGQLAAMISLATQLKMEALVEVSTEDEADRALTAGASLVAINHRDLRTFEVDLSRTARLCPRLPSHIPVVAASGIVDRDDVRRMADAGASAVLVGEALVRAADPGAKVRELAGVDKLGIGNGNAEGKPAE